jgi:hypothetical protein
MVVNGIDTLNLTYNLEELGISKANVIDAMYTKQERYEYKPGGNEVKFTYWRGKLISDEYNQEIKCIL